MKTNDGLANQFADAYGNTGFGYVINHGIDASRGPHVASKAFVIYLVEALDCS